MAIDKVRVRVGDREAFDVFFQDGQPREVEHVRVVWTAGERAVTRDMRERARIAINDAKTIQKQRAEASAP